MTGSAEIDIQLQRMNHLVRGSFVAMANPCEVLIDTADDELARTATRIAAHEARRIEQKFSRYRDDSVVHALNTAQGKPVQVDDETAQLIRFATTLWELTEGAFDITSGVLRRAWKFDGTAPAPSAETIAALLTQVGWHRVQWHPPVLTLPAGMEIDLGGIGKEYAVDRCVTLLSALGTVPMLVNFGGDLRTVGPPPTSGTWQVGIESVRMPQHAANRVHLSSGALATSGDTRRFVEHEGRRYGHIIDARTGWPAPNAPRSVTVAADTCSQAGTFATLAMLQGNQAEPFLQAQGVKFWLL